MLPKKRRISRIEFPQIITKGKRYNSPSLLLYILPQENNTPSKVSFSISKKTQNKAVVRNKFRRWGYAAVSKGINNIQNGYLLFFSFKKTAERISFSGLKEEINRLLSVSGVLI
jgi:ribonuclease P protein component